MSSNNDAARRVNEVFKGTSVNAAQGTVTVGGKSISIQKGGSTTRTSTLRNRKTSGGEEQAIGKIKYLYVVPRYTENESGRSTTALTFYVGGHQIDPVMLFEMEGNFSRIHKARITNLGKSDFAVDLLYYPFPGDDFSEIVARHPEWTEMDLSLTGGERDVVALYQRYENNQIVDEEASLIQVPRIGEDEAGTPLMNRGSISDYWWGTPGLQEEYITAWPHWLPGHGVVPFLVWQKPKTISYEIIPGTTIFSQFRTMVSYKRGSSVEGIFTSDSEVETVDTTYNRLPGVQEPDSVNRSGGGDYSQSILVESREGGRRNNITLLQGSGSYTHRWSIVNGYLGMSVPTEDQPNSFPMYGPVYGSYDYTARGEYTWRGILGVSEGSRTGIVMIKRDRGRTRSGLGASSDGTDNKPIIRMSLKAEYDIQFQFRALDESTGSNFIETSNSITFPGALDEGDGIGPKFAGAHLRNPQAGYPPPNYAYRVLDFLGDKIKTQLKTVDRFGRTWQEHVEWFQDFNNTSNTPSEADWVGVFMEKENLFFYEMEVDFINETEEGVDKWRGIYDKMIDVFDDTYTLSYPTSFAETEVNLNSLYPDGYFPKKEDEAPEKFTVESYSDFGEPFNSEEVNVYLIEPIFDEVIKDEDGSPLEINPSIYNFSYHPD